MTVDSRTSNQGNTPETRTLYRGNPNDYRKEELSLCKGPPMKDGNIVCTRKIVNLNRLKTETGERI